MSDELDRLRSRLNRPSPFSDKTDPNIVPDLSQRQGNPAPAGFVDQVRNLSENVIIDDDGITVTGGQIGEPDHTTMDADGILIVQDEVDRVRLGHIEGLPGVPSGVEHGLWIGDGGIIVVNDAGTVIIDGTSNMFKIAATGTLQVTVSAPGSVGDWTDNTASVTLSSLGAQDATLAFVAFVGSSNVSTDRRTLGRLQHYLDSGAEGAYVKDQAVVRSELDGSDLPVISVYAFNYDTLSAFTFYVRYHALQEAAF